MKRTNYMFLALLLIILISTTPIFAVDLIEEDIGDYKYDTTHFRGETEYSFPYHTLRYDKDEEKVIVAIIEFNDENYLGDWISSKTKENMSLFFDKNYIFKYNPSVKMLIWRSNNTYVQIQLYTDYVNLPEEIISAYLELYPSDCDEDGCIWYGDTIEAFCNKLRWNNPYSGNLYWKHKGFTIRCFGRVIYGREGKVTKPDLTFEQFKEEINQRLSTEMYFDEEELESMYRVCTTDDFYEIEGLPLEGFLRDCYEKAYLKLEGMIRDKEAVLETIIALCESVRSTIEENEKLIEKQKEKFGDELIDGLIDCRTNKELGNIERDKEACKNLNLEGTNMELAGCEEFYPGEGDKGVGIVQLKPCTEEDLEEGRDCIPVEERGDKKLTEELEVVEEEELEEVISEEEIVGEEEPIEKEPEPKRQNVFKKIINWIINLFR